MTSFQDVPLARLIFTSFLLTMMDWILLLAYFPMARGTSYIMRTRRIMIRLLNFSRRKLHRCFLIAYMNWHIILQLLQRLLSLPLIWRHPPSLIRSYGWTSTTLNPSLNFSHRSMSIEVSWKPSKNGRITSFIVNPKMYPLAIYRIQTPNWNRTINDPHSRWFSSLVLQVIITPSNLTYIPL